MSTKYNVQPTVGGNSSDVPEPPVQPKGDCNFQVFNNILTQSCFFSFRCQTLEGMFMFIYLITCNEPVWQLGISKFKKDPHFTYPPYLCLYAMDSLLTIYLLMVDDMSYQSAIYKYVYLTVLTWKDFWLQVYT